MEKSTDPMKPEKVLLRSIGALVRRHRKKRGMKQKELASEAGLHTTTISDIELAKVNPSITNILKIIRALKLEIGEFFASPHKESNQNAKSLARINTYLRKLDMKELNHIENIVEAFIKFLGK